MTEQLATVKGQPEELLPQELLFPSVKVPSEVSWLLLCRAYKASDCVLKGDIEPVLMQILLAYSSYNPSDQT